MTFSIVSKPVSGSNAANQIGHEPQYWHGYVKFSFIFWTSKVDTVSIESLSKGYVLIHKDIPIMPAIFLIVGNVAGDIIDSIIDSARPMIDDRVIYDVTVGIYNIESESVPQDLGKPVAASTAKAFNDFLSFTIIRESRYELHHHLMQL